MSATCWPVWRHHRSQATFGNEKNTKRIQHPSTSLDPTDVIIMMLLWMWLFLSSTVVFVCFILVKHYDYIYYYYDGNYILPLLLSICLFHYCYYNCFFQYITNHRYWQWFLFVTRWWNQPVRSHEANWPGALSLLETEQLSRSGCHVPRDLDSMYIQKLIIIIITE